MDSRMMDDLPQQQRRGHTVKDNVITLRRDAAYFHERGLRYLEKNDLRRALKAFRRTVQLEPDNPVNHCNVAGVLAELGEFEAANQVLEHVLTDIDPTMAECRFYMANNYACMGDFDEAQRCVIQYLDSAPDGEYAAEAEEMLDVLVDEFGAGEEYAAWQAKRRAEERARAERDGRHLLEQGQFEAAVEWLENVIQREPDNLPAHNNLSLACYYTGQYDRAVQLAESVLARQPDNIHALCNLALFSAHLGPRDRFRACVQRLSKLFPLHYDQAMKVGTTLGLIGEHRAALSVFAQLARLVDRADALLIHSAAAAAANSGYLRLARRWWKQLRQFPGLEGVAAYYLRASERALARGRRSLRVGYQCEVPLRAQYADLKKRINLSRPEKWRDDPLWRASLYWGLRHGWRETQRAVIRTLALIADADAEKALRLFLQRPDVEPAQQAAALFALQRMGARGRVSIHRNGELTSMRMSEVPKDVILQADPAWLEVWNRTEAWLREHRKGRYLAEARRAWIAYLKYVFVRSDFKVHKPQVWVAGLVYATLRRHNEPVRQKDVAEWLNVSVSSVSKAAGRLSMFFVKMPEV